MIATGLAPRALVIAVDLPLVPQLLDAYGASGILSNNNVRIQGDWHKVEMDFPNTTTYTFTEAFISVDGEEWASYKLLRGSRIEVTTRGDVVTYELSFPDDENMVWSIRKGDTLNPRVRWRR